MSQLLDFKEDSKKTKQSKFPKYMVLLIGGVFLIDGVVGFSAFFYKMNTTWINFAFSLLQIYIGLKFILSRPSIGDILLSFFMLVILTFSIYSSTFTSVFRNGLYFELGSGENMFQSGVEYTLFYEMSHASREFEVTLDLLYLTLLFLLIFVMINRLFSNTKKTKVTPEVDLT
jgi:hypothetical protein